MINRNKNHVFSQPHKSMVAKLLATENITVTHKNIHTAMFDTLNRALYLPMWENTSEYLYNLLIGHETGHALDTPGFAQGMTVESFKKILRDIDPANMNGVKSFINVVEDARIEKHQKNRYPGLRKSFVEGYKELIARDFFGTAKIDVNTMRLIDRINIHTKAGSLSTVKFTPEEQKYVTMVEGTETWADVLDVVKKLYDYAKSESQTDRHQNQEQEEGQEGDGDGEGEEEMDSDMQDPQAGSEGEGKGEGDEESDKDSDKDGKGSKDSDKESDKDGKGEKPSKSKNKNQKDEKNDKPNKASNTNLTAPSKSNEAAEPPSAKTDMAWEENRKKLSANSGNEPTYYNVPRAAHYEDVIVDYKKVLKDLECMVSKNQFVKAEAQRFRNVNRPIVSFMAKEFEIKKAADEHRRAITAKTGSLNMNKIHSYKYNEDLFQRNTTVQAGKNHGVMMFIDWSSSMYGNMAGTVEQLMNLILFCKRVNIPFEVYGFSDYYNRKYGEDAKNTEGLKNGDVVMKDYALLNFMSSRMNFVDYNKGFDILAALHNYYSNHSYYGANGSGNFVRNLPRSYQMGSTPLNSAIFSALELVPAFQRKNKVQIMNTIFLTDGASNLNINYKDTGTISRGDMYNGKDVVFRDSVTGATYHTNQMSYTQNVLQILKDRTQTNLVGFFIAGDSLSCVESEVNRFVSPGTAEHRVILEKTKKTGYAAIPDCGYDELYIIQGGNSMKVAGSDFTVKKGADLQAEFSKFNSAKVASRQVLSRFIEKISA